MIIDVLTLFPEMFDAGLQTSILGRALSDGLLQVKVTNFREFATDRHHTVDDYPFGGGAGMVLKPDPIFSAVESILSKSSSVSEDDFEHHTVAKSVPIILLSPQGRVFSHDIACELSQHKHMIFICGHYEGFDERIRERLVTDEISIGDFVLTGGELAAMVVIDAVARLLPGVLGNADSAPHDSFAEGLLEHPQYTRPREYRDWGVPEILLSGHHGHIAEWRRKQSLLRTLRKRPELLERISISDEERNWLNAIVEESIYEDK